MLDLYINPRFDHGCTRGTKRSEVPAKIGQHGHVQRMESTGCNLLKAATSTIWLQLHTTFFFVMLQFRQLSGKNESCVMDNSSKWPSAKFYFPCSFLSIRKRISGTKHLLSVSRTFAHPDGKSQDSIGIPWNQWRPRSTLLTASNRESPQSLQRTQSLTIVTVPFLKLK